jgi:4-alpha-glucanotransferase
MDLLAQAQIKGVQSEFVDALGKLRITAPEALKSILDALPEKRVYRFVSGPVVVRALGNPRTELAAVGAAPLQWKVTGNGNVIAKGETREPGIAWRSVITG